MDDFFVGFPSSLMSEYMELREQKLIQIFVEELLENRLLNFMEPLFSISLKHSQIKNPLEPSRSYLCNELQKDDVFRTNSGFIQRGLSYMISCLIFDYTIYLI